MDLIKRGKKRKKNHLIKDSDLLCREGPFGPKFTLNLGKRETKLALEIEKTIKRDKRKEKMTMSIRQWRNCSEV